MPPSPNQLIALAATALNTTPVDGAPGEAQHIEPGSERGNGVRIGTAIEVAGISADMTGDTADAIIDPRQPPLPGNAEHSFEL
ncbi:hypothetical protein [Nocardia nepalensis]|uniref:hypothetical protein n=1 Tax=Nocardia nepalensis TaxID=3375448 RepID=UPI003B674AB4